MRNLVFASISTLPLFAAMLDPRDIGSILVTLIVSVILASFGKLADFAIKYYLMRRFGPPRGGSDS